MATDELTMRDLTVRDMAPEEAPLRIDYFHRSPAPYLVSLGIDPARLPERDAWCASFAAELAVPRARATTHGLVWSRAGRSVGFSTADRIAAGAEAFMHLHLLDPGDRRRGFGTVLVRRSAARYLALFDLERLYSEPNACNLAPNRCLQRAGFSFLAALAGVPGPFHFPQVTIRWVIERAAFDPSELERARDGLDG